MNFETKKSQANKSSKTTAEIRFNFIFFKFVYPCQLS